MADFLADYVDVQTRIKLFYEKYPDGSIQFEFKGFMPGSNDYIWGIATAYRNQDDQRPSTGTASEAAQGKTAYTRGSELMNLETSAIGRAISAFGIGIGKSMASSHEVQMANQRETERKMAPGTPEKIADPWEMDANPSLKLLGEMGMTPDCVHGQMVRKEGEKNGRSYAGWVCPNNNKSCAIWE